MFNKELRKYEENGQNEKNNRLHLPCTENKIARIETEEKKKRKSRKLGCGFNFPVSEHFDFIKGQRTFQQLLSLF